MRNLLLAVVTITITLSTTSLHAVTPWGHSSPPPPPGASLGDKCKTGLNVANKYLCPMGKVCLQAIGNMYCSNAGKVCGWSGTGGYPLGAKKTYGGKQYECKLNGFKRVSSSSGGSTSGGNSGSSGNSSGTIGGMIMPTIPTRYRSLKPKEKDILRSVYGNTLNFKTVTITDGQGLGGLSWVTQTPTGYLVNLEKYYSIKATTGEQKWLLIHEMAHVWQGQHGINFTLNSAVHQAWARLQSGDRNGAYDYQPVGQQWSKYNSEQQAFIVQTWFSRGKKTSDELYPYIRDNVRAGKPHARTKFK